MSRPLNPDWPIPDVGSVDELMSIAVAMEAEAARRYDQLARRVGARGQDELAALFARLAQLEREHQHGLERWAGREMRPTPMAARFGWHLPETFGDEADERPLDPYLALAVAVRNEERAFAFYSYLSAQCAATPALRARAESLAREELAHVALLRGMRRQAFHRRERRPPPPRVHTVAELARLARGLAAGSAELDRLSHSALAGHPASRLLGTPAIDPGQPAGPGSNTVEQARRRGALVPGALAAEDLLRLAVADAQEILDLYLSVADAASDEDVLTRAQQLAERAMARLALVNEMAAQVRA
ncbi:MAG TPA: ferritin family protein [Magnetospirillum sp.]|nr:ferritin family protein [Magnetospirillum sp.]